MVTPVVATEVFNPSQEWVEENRILSAPAFRALRRIFLGIVEPKSPSAVTVPASPATLTAGSHGSFVIQGGTVSVISLIRTSTVVVTGVTTGVIPVLRGDQVRITYTVVPTVTFFGS